MKKALSTIAAVLAGTFLLAGCSAQVSIDPEATMSPTSSEGQADTGDSSDQVVGDLEAGPATGDQTIELLTYLIEEEKLAHDVYTVLYEEYDSQVFANILESESTHQEQVLVLLAAYGVDDPRSSEIGVFNDPELQALFDTLIAKGMLSETDAFEVGVMIEEKDIADITTQLETASDADVIDTLERLRSGSENHLRAFNRQL